LRFYIYVVRKGGLRESYLFSLTRNIVKKCKKGQSFTYSNTRRVHIGVDEKIGGVSLPSQLELTPHLC
jgi:hypothetical protein